MQLGERRKCLPPKKALVVAIYVPSNRLSVTSRVALAQHGSAQQGKRRDCSTVDDGRRLRKRYPTYIKPSPRPKSNPNKPLQALKRNTL